MRLRQLNIGCFGGGTGLPSLLGGLKSNPWLRLHAVVTMFDSGGSSGQLRDELGVLPPGDVLKCALALARNEPARSFARRVDLLRLAELPQQILVFVSHPWGGGIRRYMNDLASLLGDRAEVLYVEPADENTVKLYWPREGESFAAYFRLPDELSLLADVLKSIGVARLHFHHVHRLPRAILELPSAVGVPFDCTLHDYFAICPQYHLVTEDGRYCGEPDAIGCAACLARRPGQWGLDINDWRGVFAEFLRGADRVIAPSNDVSERIRRYFPELSVNVWPHPEEAPAQLKRVVRVVVVGNLTPAKGLHVVAACANGRSATPDPSFVFGYSTDMRCAIASISRCADWILVPGLSRPTTVR